MPCKTASKRDALLLLLTLAVLLSVTNGGRKPRYNELRPCGKLCLRRKRTGYHRHSTSSCARKVSIADLTWRARCRESGPDRYRSHNNVPSRSRTANTMARGRSVNVARLDPSRLLCTRSRAGALSITYRTVQGSDLLRTATGCHEADRVPRAAAEEYGWREGELPDLRPNVRWK